MDKQKALEIANEIALELGSTGYYYNIQSELALVYTNSGEAQKSQDLVKSFPKKFYPLLLAGTNYFRLNQYDSAYYYLNKALNTDNVYTKQDAYRILYKYKMIRT